MRTLVTTMAAVAALMVAGAASAVPTASLTFTNSTGSGTTGGSSIDALPGDVLRLLITIEESTPAILYSASISLSWSDANLVGAVPGINGVGGFGECPTPENTVTAAFNAPNCTDDGGFSAGITPFAAGVAIGATTANGFDAGSLSGITDSSGNGVTRLFLGAIEFTVGAGIGALTDIQIDYTVAPGQDGVTWDNAGTAEDAFPSASAQVIVPEPGTAGLMGLGLLALGVVGRRRN